MPKIKEKRRLAIDTETTGLDIRHGAKPFMVTMADSLGDVHSWEWAVDPFKREPLPILKDLKEIQREIDQADEIIFQNAKFDVAALKSIFPGIDIPWDKVVDTILAAHLLASNYPKDLTSLCAKYLRHDIGKYDKDVQAACVGARRVARKKEFVSKHGEWRIANVDLPEMPSAKGGKSSIAKADMWLPRAVASVEKYEEDHDWFDITLRYALMDAEATLALWGVQERIIKERKLDKIFKERLNLLPIVFGMESYGVTVNRVRLARKLKEYTKEIVDADESCKDIAKKVGLNLVLPKGGTNKSLLEYAKHPKGLNLGEVNTDSAGLDKGKGRSKAVLDIAKTKTGEVSLKASVLEYLEDLLSEEDPDGDQLKFIKNFRQYRKLGTAVSYANSYQRFGIPIDKSNTVLYPSLNPVGTNTLRWSSSNPNEQNISKQEGTNLRYVFGPLPGREWWSMDAKNIELRIPAYESGEIEIIELFENEDQPPYYGSYHMLIFDTLHPEKFEKYGMECKKEFASTWYQWTKNGNFAVQYGAMEESGTADRAYHVKGAQRRIKSRFKALDGLNRSMIQMANRLGYVETIPDRSIDAERGYPLICTRDNWGRIKPTVPLNYRTQGTAMQWMSRAMVRTSRYLREVNDRLGIDSTDNYYRSKERRTKEYKIALQVHDELVFDFPAPTEDDMKRNGLNHAWEYNLPVIRDLKKLMEAGGKDIGVNTPVGVEYHPDNWSEGISVHV